MTGRAWLGTVVSAVLFALLLLFLVHPFLALTDPVAAQVLVVEGWVEDYALEFTAKEFRAGNYTRLCSTGGPVSKGSYLVEYKTFAELGAATLRALGLTSNVVVAVPAPAARLERTFQSALALRQWFQNSGQPVKAMNVITIGAHARRTRLIYQRVFGDEVAIGIITVPNADYDANRWWKFSAGVRDVAVETCGFVYAKLIAP